MSNKTIIKNFVVCGKPTFKNNEHVGWKVSFVKISEIKTIHEEESSTPDNKRCIFYTYKDEWYAVTQMDHQDLVKAVNEYIDEGKN